MAAIQTTTRFINVKESQDELIEYIYETQLGWIAVMEEIYVWNGIQKEVHEKKTYINVNHIIEIQP
jgi:hypothetical protein